MVIISVNVASYSRLVHTPRCLLVKSHEITKIPMKSQKFLEIKLKCWHLKSVHQFWEFQYIYYYNPYIHTEITWYWHLHIISIECLNEYSFCGHFNRVIKWTHDPTWTPPHIVRDRGAAISNIIRQADDVLPCPPRGTHINTHTACTHIHTHKHIHTCSVFIFRFSFAYIINLASTNHSLLVLYYFIV